MDKSKADDAHKEALDRFERALEADRDNLDRAWDALSFYAGNQWDSDILQQRRAEERPCLVVNELPRFVRQITGDMRMSKPAIKIVPVDSATDPAIAEIYESIVRQIEGASDAKAAYFTACDSQVVAGIGHWRVVAEYASDDVFDQDLKIVPVRDGVSVLWDPAAERRTRDDAMFCFVPVDMPRDDFEAKYPGAQIVDTPTSNSVGDWFSDDKVRLAEYWVKKPFKRKVALLKTGQTIAQTDANKEAYEEARAMGLIAREEEREGFKICYYVMSGAEFLEGPIDWPGRYIPIVPVIGEEIQLERRTVRRSLIHNAMDSQRIKNFFESAQVEYIALQPKAPFIGTHKNFEENLADWENANRTPLPYLGYTPDPSNGNAPPQRSLPPTASAGFEAAITRASENLKATTGLYDAALGMRSNETSGKAILARQREGDVGSFVFFDNFAQAVAHTGRIIVDLIPHYYDTERVVRVLGRDGTEKAVKVNAIDPVTGQVQFDLTSGKYDIVIDAGPSYATKREEAREGMTTLLQAAGPQGLALIGDLYVRMQDWPYADEIAERLASLRDQGQQGPDPSQAIALEVEAKRAENAVALEAKQQEAEIDLAKRQREMVLQLRAKKIELSMQQKAKRIDAESSVAMRANEISMNADASGATALAEALAIITQSVQSTNETVSQALAMIANSAAAPKRVVRDASGAVVGVEPVQ